MKRAMVHENPRAAHSPAKIEGTFMANDVSALQSDGGSVEQAPEADPVGKQRLRGAKLLQLPAMPANCPLSRGGVGFGTIGSTADHVVAM